MRYNNKFFKTEEEAKAFQKQHGGALYKNTWGSRTKREFSVECAVARDARGEFTDDFFLHGHSPFAFNVCQE